MRCNEFLISVLLYFFVFQNQCLTQSDPFCCSENTRSCDFSQKYNSQENKENIALCKYATSSALWNRNDGQDSGPPCVAVNGNTSSTFASISSSSPNCIYSDGSSTGDWWQVDLGDNYTITSVTIYQTKSYLSGLKWVNISVDDHLCNALNGDYITTPSVNILCTTALKGRHITIAKFNPSSDQQYLTFCEVQVWVCMAGFYDPDCEETCGNCVGGNRTCDRYTGECPSECTPGFYGKNCTLNCPENCLNINCSQEDGSCGGRCKPEFAGDKCDECAPGHYGKNCSLNCSENCLNTSCSQEDGSCGGRCKGPFTGDKCDECTPGHYGKDCSFNCPENCLNTSCSQEDGSCGGRCKDPFTGDKCNECTPGLYGKDCSFNCPENCLNTSCSQEDGSCGGRCKGLFTGDKCNACNNGTYGPNCALSCGKCTDDVQCDSVNGSCISCAPGFIPPLCQSQCDYGSFGQDCTMRCGKCLGGNSVCNKTSGICLFGCENGWSSVLCNQDSAAQTDNGDLVGAIVGAILGAGLLIAIAIIIAVYMWLRNSKRSRQSDVQHQVKARYNQNIEKFSLHKEINNALYENDVATTKKCNVPARIPAQETYVLKSTDPENQYDKLSSQYANGDDCQPYDDVRVSNT